MSKRKYSRETIPELIDRVLTIIGEKTNSINPAELSMEDLKTLLSALTSLSTVYKEYKSEIDIFQQAVKNLPTSSLQEVSKIFSIDGKHK